jgi:hypothetical protein
MRYGYSLLLLNFLFTSVATAEVTPDNIYAQVSKINQEVEIIKRHFNIHQTATPINEIKITLSPHHLWQKTCEIFYKIKSIREKHNLPLFTIPSQEPVKRILLSNVYEQNLRILTELNILKFQLDIKGKGMSSSSSPGKTITDSFNLLSTISSQLDLLNGAGIDPSLIFAQAMQIHEDIDILLEALEIKSEIIPPLKQPDVTPASVFDTALQLLKEIKHVQDLTGVNSIELYTFKSSTLTTLNEVFTITGIILAELQLLKAHLQIRQFTPPTNYYRDRMSNDVQQILGWSIKKVHLIRSLN